MEGTKKLLLFSHILADSQFAVININRGSIIIIITMYIIEELIRFLS